MVVIECHDARQFQVEIGKAKDKLVLIDFFATWCGPCKQISPFVEKLSEQHKEAVFLKVDVDKCQEVAQQYKVKAMPTFTFIHKGNVLNQMEGADPRKLEETLKSLLAKLPKATPTFSSPGHSLQGGPAAHQPAIGKPGPVAMHPSTSAQPRRNPWADPTFVAKKLGQPSGGGGGGGSAASGAPSGASGAGGGGGGGAGSGAGAGAGAGASAGPAHPVAWQVEPPQPASAGSRASAVGSGAGLPVARPTASLPAAAPAARPTSLSHPTANPAVLPDPLLLAELVDMGFDKVQSEKALAAVRNRDLDSAVTWLMDNPAPASEPAAISPPTTVPAAAPATVHAAAPAAPAASAHALPTTTATSAGATAPPPEQDAEEDEDVKMAIAASLHMEPSGAAAAADAGAGAHHGEVGPAAHGVKHMDVGSEEVELDPEMAQIIEEVRFRKEHDLKHAPAKAGAPASKPVSEMTSQEKMEWLAKKRAEVKLRKEKEKIALEKDRERSRKEVAKAAADLTERKAQFEKDAFISQKKKEDRESHEAMKKLRAKIAEDKVRRQKLREAERVGTDANKPGVAVGVQANKPAAAASTGSAKKDSNKGSNKSSNKK